MASFLPAPPGASPGHKKAPLHKCAGALLFFSAHDAGDEDLQTDADEDDAAEDGGFAGEFGAELFADGKAGLATAVVKTIKGLVLLLAVAVDIISKRKKS